LRAAHGDPADITYWVIHSVDQRVGWQEEARPDDGRTEADVKRSGAREGEDGDAAQSDAATKDSDATERRQESTSRCVHPPPRRTFREPKVAIWVWPSLWTGFMFIKFV